MNDTGRNYPASVRAGIQAVRRRRIRSYDDLYFARLKREPPEITVKLSGDDVHGPAGRAADIRQTEGRRKMSTAPTTTLHYAPNANLANNGSYDAVGDPGSIGFNLADISSQADADSLPPGVQGLLWIGGDTVAQAESIIAATANDTKIYGYYVADEPSDSDLATVNTINQYIAQNAPGKVSFIVAENDGTPTAPSYAATPQSTDAYLIGLDPYPVRPQFTNGVNYSVISAAVQEAESVGWQQNQIVPVYQAFGGGGYGGAGGWTLPTAAQEQQTLATWATLTPNPKFDYAYSWGTQDSDSALVNTPSLQAVFQQLFIQESNGGSGSGGGGGSNTPTISFTGPTSEPLASSGETALVGVGVTSTDATDPLTATLSDASDALIVDGKSHAAGVSVTLTGTASQINADLADILAGANVGTVNLVATQDSVTQTAAISLETVGTPSMTFLYNVRQNESIAAPSSGTGPVVYDIGMRGTGTLTIADFRPGTDILQFVQGVTATSVAPVGGGLEFNLSNHGHVLLAGVGA